LQRVVTILIISLFISACSVIKKGELSQNLNINNTGKIIEDIKNQNITEFNFFIEKAEIELITKNEKQKFVGSIKFIKPDKYLISLKSRTGIEGARIYLSEDSIFINDRINKKLYFGSSYYIRKNFGVTTKIFPLIFGDIILDRNCEHNEINCTKTISSIGCNVKGIKLNYDIDCNRRKTILVKQSDNINSGGFDIMYDRFYNVGNVLMPHIINIKELQYNMEIRIRILKIELPWDGRINFIPGKGYELVELL
jgi:hypothetical protein